MLLTAQVARGFRLGGINDPLNVPLCARRPISSTYSGQPTFEDEKVLNYELGAKTQLADGRVTFNAAVFYSDIDDLQVIADAGSCSSRIVLNAQAESIGGEVELLARPERQLGSRHCPRPTCRPRSRETRTNADRHSRSPAFATAIACRPRRSSRPRRASTYNWPFAQRWKAS